jgi:hypothetical protein
MGLENRIEKLEQHSGISNRASGDACRCPTIGYETRVILPTVDGSPAAHPPAPPRICKVCGRQQRITTVVVQPGGKTYRRES